MNTCTPSIGKTLALALFYFLALAPFSSVSAQSVDVLCTGTETAYYTPGLTFTPQYTEFVATSDYSTCTSVSDPAITSGIIEWEGSGDLSCLSGGSTGTATITWNTSEISDFSFETAVAQRPNGNVVILLDGEITAGKFVGATMLQELTLLNLDLLGCMTGGVDMLSGPVQMQILTI